MSNKAPIRVVHLLHTMAYGGIETVIINWFAEVNCDLDMHLVIFSNPGETERPFLEAARDKNVPVSLINWGKHKPIFKAAKELKILLRKFDAQILHTHNTYAGLVGLIAGKQLGLKLINTYYVWDDVTVGIKRRMIQQLDVWALKKYDLLTAQCEKTIDDSVKLGFKRDKVLLVPSGFPAMPISLEPKKRGAIRRERRVSDDTVLVCNVARFYPEKAQEMMLDCWKLVNRSHPETMLWIFGVGPLEQALRAHCTKLGLDHCVEFKGFADSLELELELCDIQFHPSYNEGIPLAICSGMAAGLPIVASRVGGLPEVIKHGESGLLVDDGDRQGFVREMNHLIEYPDYRRVLGDGAKRFIQEEYSIEYAVKELVKIYQTLA